MVQPLEGFLVSVNSPTYGLAPPLPSPLPLRICLQGSTSRGFAPAMSIRQARLSFCVTPSVPNDGIGMLTDCPSPTAFALGLGPTNPPRMTLAAEPSDLRRQRFSLCSRYSSQHSLFQSLHRSSPSGFAVMERSSTKWEVGSWNLEVGLLRLHPSAFILPDFRSFGGTLEPRYIFRTRTLDQ